MHEAAPEGWARRRLADVATVVTGSTPSSDQDGSFGGGTPFATPSDLTAGGLVTATERSLSDRGAASARLVPPGSTLFVCIGSTIGKLAQAGTTMATNQQINAAVPRSGIDPDWLNAALASQSERVSRMAGRQAVPIVSKSEFEKLELLVPPSDEQSEIGEYWRQWDRAIAVSDALLAEKRRTFSWIRGSVLTGLKRLSRFSAPWATVSLLELLHEHGLRSTGREAVYSVSVHRGLIDQIEHLGRSFAANDTSGYNRVLPGDIVYTKSPTGDFPLGIVKRSQVNDEVIVSPLYGVFTPSSEPLGIVLDALFSSPAFAERYLAPLVTKGAKNTINVTNSRFLAGSIYLPTDVAELSAVADIVKVARKEIDLLSARAAALRRQKRGLMQKLLTGQWRLSQTALNRAAE